MNILFLGKPGSGKGTITEKLKKDGFLHLSTGNLLRAEEEKGTKLGKEIGVLINGGNFVPDEMIFTLVDKFLEENKGFNIMFDGFPRNLKQSQECIEKNIIFDKVVVLEIEDDLIKNRIVNRRVHTPSGRVYNTKTLPPKVEGKDDITGDSLVHREDDKENVIAHRLEIYKSVTEPIVNFLSEKNYNILKVDASQEIDTQVEFVRKNIINSKKIKIK